MKSKSTQLLKNIVCLFPFQRTKGKNWVPELGALLPFLGGFVPTKIDCRKKLVPTYSSLPKLGLGSQGPRIRMRKSCVWQASETLGTVVESLRVYSTTSVILLGISPWGVSLWGWPFLYHRSDHFPQPCWELSKQPQLPQLRQFGEFPIRHGGPNTEWCSLGSVQPIPCLAVFCWDMKRTTQIHRAQILASQSPRKFTVSITPPPPEKKEEEKNPTKQKKQCFFLGGHLKHPPPPPKKKKARKRGQPQKKPKLSS